MKKSFLIGTSLTLVVLLAFVYFAQPIKAKADEPALNFQTTSDDLATVKAQITGMEAALIPIVFIIIGFIALTYCTLRNVNVPLSYSSDTAFIDKCSQLGHYCFDNATEKLKPVLYSVYSFVASGQVTDPNNPSVINPFLISELSKFFAAFAAWLNNSSFVSNIDPTAEGLLNNFSLNPFAKLLPVSAEHADLFTTSFNSYNVGIDITKVIGGFYNGSYFYGFSVIGHLSDFYVGIQVIEQDLYLYFYKVVGSSLVKTSYEYNLVSVSCSPYTWTVNATPTLTRLYSDSVHLRNNTNSSWKGYLNPSEYIDIIKYFGGIPFTATAYNNTIALDSITIAQDDSITSPFSDTIYNPALNQIAVNIDNLGDRVSDLQNQIASLSGMIALLTNDQTLTLDSAIAGDPAISGGGEYVFPSMNAIWKYPQYFFDTLHSWGIFVKGCLSAVTVGEGGLSWIFYGGFVILICGGIIGKILLG